MGSAPRKQSKTYKVPKRPYEAARLDAELKVGLDWHRHWHWQRLGRSEGRKWETMRVLDETGGRGGLSRRSVEVVVVVVWLGEGSLDDKWSTANPSSSSPASTVSATSVRSGASSSPCPR
jgi:hypothetical protein